MNALPVEEISWQEAATPSNVSMVDVGDLGQNYIADEASALNDNTAPKTTLQKLGSLFASAVNTTISATAKTIHQAGSLAYDFVKANPIVSGVGADIALTGGVYTQAAIVGVVETVAGAAGELATDAATGVWGYLFN